MRSWRQTTWTNGSIKLLWRQHVEEPVRGRRPRVAEFVVNPLLQRDPQWQQYARSQVLDLLSRGPARVADIAIHVGADESRTHDVIRGLRDDQHVHADSGYWVLGPRQNRRW